MYVPMTLSTNLFTPFLELVRGDILKAVPVKFIILTKHACSVQQVCIVNATVMVIKVVYMT